MTDLAALGLLALGRRPSHAVEKLAGASGSGVFRLDADAGGHVLKVTESARADARRELSFYQELGGKVPVRTPRFLDGVGRDDLTVLLITAAEPGPPARTWDRTRWLDVAGQLGTLHRFLDRRTLAAHPWLRAEQPATDVAPPERVSLWSRSPLAPKALPMLSDLEQLRTALHRLPSCLVHGDCHADNLLRDADDNLVWVDWAEVGVGRGPEELAILWQRAEFDGATVPRELMIDAYARARGIKADDVLREAVRAAELLMVLLGWPAFLIEQPSLGRDALFAHFERLASR
jgi:Ser/Thr protein kinase RdoA (MazF antagonist)